MDINTENRSFPEREVLVKVRLRQGLGQEYLPGLATPSAAGADLRAAFDGAEAEIKPGQRLAVPSGVFIEITRPGLAAFVLSRSGLGARDGLTVAQGVGLIDPDYRGEIIVWLLNTSPETRIIKKGERIAQLVLMPVTSPRFELADHLSDTSRGAGGFGHSGRV